MYKHKLQVYGEDLAVADISQTSAVTGEAVIGGGTNGGLVVNVFAETAATVASTVTVAIEGSDSEDGSFSAVTSATLPAATFAAGDLIAQIPLPPDAPMWLKGKVTGNASSSGTVCVTLGYLPR